MTYKFCISPLATRPILYTDTVKGEQTCRDDLWAVTTDELNALHRATQQAAPEAPTAWLATDLDGRGDVAWTKEEAKRRAGESCTEFVPLYTSSVAAPEAPAGEPYCIALHSDGTTTDLTHLTASSAAITASSSGAQQREFCTEPICDDNCKFPRCMARATVPSYEEMNGDAEGLPPLPHPVCIDGYLQFTAEQVRQAQREAVAAYRTQQPAQGASIDTPEFRALLADCYEAIEKTYMTEVLDHYEDLLIAYIDARRAAVSTTGDAWISVAERLPDLHVTVALLDENRWMNTGSSDHNVNWHGAGYLCEFGQKYWSVFGEMRSQCLDAVTHWLPLPAAPQSPTEEGSQP